MSVSLLRCSGCDTGYDVSQRTPGHKVRCPRCQTVLTVPDPQAAEGAPVTESGILRRARGPSCARHPRAVARGRCARCEAATCRACQAPPPLDHLCGPCVTVQELGGVVKADFGLFATPRLALRAFLPSVAPIFLWSVFAALVGVTVCALPAALGGFAFLEHGLTRWSGTFGAGVALGALIAFWVGTELLLVPAGSALLVDRALRGRPLPVGEGLFATWHRVIRNAGVLFQVFLVYFLLALLLLLPSLPVAAWLLERTDSWATAAAAPAVFLGLGVVLVLPALGLAVPIVILEERPALQSLQRAWALAQPRYPTLLALTVAFTALYAAGTGGLALLGIDGLLLVVPRLLDLFIPALLVAAYHGLASEQAGVLGRAEQ